MKPMYETPDEQAGHVEEVAPVTLTDALATMDPSLAVEPVADSIPTDDTAEPSEAAPGDEVAEEAVEEVEEEVEEEIEEETADLKLVADEDEEEVSEDEEEAQGAFTLKVGEVELDLEVEDEETRAALVEMQNDLARISDVDATVERTRESALKNQRDSVALQQIEEELRLDPAGYIGDRVHPSIRVELAKSLLLDDEVLQAVEDTLTKWIDDPSQRQVDAAERKATRVEQKEMFRAQRERVRADQENATAVFDKIMEITPADMDHATAKMWHTDAITEIQQHVRDNDIEKLDPEQIPHILAARMQLYGIGTTARVVRAQPADERGKDLEKQLKAAKEMPDRIRKRVSKRKTVATTPSGAGGAPGRTQVQKGATLDQVLADLKQRVRQ